MTATVVTTPSGSPSLRYLDEHLEDPVDPWAGARAFVQEEQLAGVDHVVLFGGGLGYRAARLAELGVTPVVFEPCPGVPDLAAGPTTPEAPRFTRLEDLHAHLLRISRPDQRTVLLTPPPYRRAFPEAHDRVAEVLDEVQGLVLLRHNSIEERSALLAERALSNLPLLTRVPVIDRLDRPLAGTPAFIVSAGPSLDRNRARLREAATVGAVFVVNTAAPAVAAVDAPIDLLVAIEALDVAEPLSMARDQARGVALDLTSGGPNFGVPIDPKVTFLADAAQYRALARSLGVGTLAYGGSVATAAFALAHRLGADPVVLVGQDLAYTAGRGYASDTLYAGTTVRRDGALLVIDRVAKWDETTRAAGLKVPSKVRPAMAVPAWGGGTVDTTHELTMFRRWFEMAARELGRGIRLVNATEGGARIAGFEERPLADVVASASPREDRLAAAMDRARPVDRATVSAAAETIERSADRVAKAAERCRRAKVSAVARAEAQLRAVARDAPLVEAHAASPLSAIRKRDDLSAEERAEATYAAIRASARRVAELATEARASLGPRARRHRAQGRRRRARHPSRKARRSRA
ncbi:MAG: 6-hydroxymethylpterin diphosphokinase MptE-like protein [Sandaracinaceae bacterium]